MFVHSFCNIKYYICVYFMFNGRFKLTNSLMFKIKIQITHNRIKFCQWIILMNNNIKEKYQNNFVTINNNGISF